jgi:putative oxygen-independent coproporphyrinogen III oxidase
MNTVPRALYVHIPWCIRKCPYCDFNSHEANDPPFADYGMALVRDLENDLERYGAQPFGSVFFGGGTPSLMPPEALKPLFQILQSSGLIDQSTEITIEANPGTRDLGHLPGYFDLGINRLSIGVQSFQQQQLAALGRIHQGDDAIAMIEEARQAGFKRINVDLMHGTPGQTPDDVKRDLDQIQALGLTHLSWYQLTIEPNTAFYSHPPTLPSESLMEAAEILGSDRIAAMGLAHYEVSAYAAPGEEARHNINYWEFGDYLGLGAGAHGKVTSDGAVIRTTRTRQPHHYLRRVDPAAQETSLSETDLGAECLMNGLRLKAGISYAVFEERTGLNADTYRGRYLGRADGLGLLEPGRFQATDLGWRHLNSLLEMLV